MGFITITVKDNEEAMKVHEEIRSMIAKDPELAGDIPITLDIQTGEQCGKYPKLPKDAAVSLDALAPLFARYGNQVDSYDLGRVLKQVLQEIYLIADREADLEKFQETFEQNKDLFDSDADQPGRSIPVFVYSVATDHASKFYPERSFTEKHVSLMKKLFGEGRVYEFTAPAKYVFNWQGSTVPNEVRDYGREGFRKGWFDTEDKTEAENSLFVERLQNYFSLLDDDMSKVRHIKNLTSDEVSVTDAALVMIWKELHELNAKMN